MSKKEGRRKCIIKGVGYIVYLFVIVFILLEVGLRIYNPFHLRLKGDKIVLPVNQQITITNKINPRLDPVIVNTRNSLGLRGPELPAGEAGKRGAVAAGAGEGRVVASGSEAGRPVADKPDAGAALLKIITIGGSTTECHFLNDDRTWPYLLGKKISDSFCCSWLNNAGLDGHSTYGHIVLLNGHIKRLHPSVVVFLTGINDVENPAPTFHDKMNTRGAVPDWRHYIFENSEVLNLALNLVRGWRAQKFNNTTAVLDLPDSLHRRPLTEDVMRRRLSLQAPYLAAYRTRLEQLADTCTAWGILPVFITQPNLYGIGRDPVTGADLELYPTDVQDTAMNGRLIWQMLEQYNAVVREMCARKGLPVIDLAHRMPKNSLYFYDMSHFTNAGAEEVASIVDSALLPVLETKFPAYRRK